MKAFPALLLLMASANLCAQPVVAVEMNGKPLIYMSEGRPHGCGLGITGGYTLEAIVEYVMFEVSVNFFPPRLGLVKFGSYNTSPEEVRRNDPPRHVEVTHGWIRALDAAATKPLGGKTDKGEDGVSLLYNAAELDPVFAILLAPAEGRQINIGLRRRGEDREHVHAGWVNLSKEEGIQLLRCLDQITPRPNTRR